MKILVIGGAGFIGSHIVPAYQGDQKRSSLSWDLAKKELRWKPICELEQGLKRTVEWFQSYQKVS